MQDEEAHALEGYLLEHSAGNYYKYKKHVIASFFLLMLDDMKFYADTESQSGIDKVIDIYQDFILHDGFVVDDVTNALPVLNIALSRARQLTRIDYDTEDETMSVNGAASALSAAYHILMIAVGGNFYVAAIRDAIDATGQDIPFTREMLSKLIDSRENPIPDTGWKTVQEILEEN